MQYKKTALVVNEEPVTLNLLKTLLSGKNYKVICALDGEEALRMRKNHNPDIILLDLELPDIDGLRVLKEIKQQSQTPVIIVSERREERDKVEALECGAVDYITKPFGSAELLARVKNILALYEKLLSGNKDKFNIYRYNGFVIDYSAYRVISDGKEIHLTPIEYKIVELLAKNAGMVLTHEQIINHIWGPNNCIVQVLRVNIGNIRKKIERDPSKPEIIETVLGVGYRLGEESLARDGGEPQ